MPSRPSPTTSSPSSARVRQGVAPGRTPRRRRPPRPRRLRGESTTIRAPTADRGAARHVQAEAADGRSAWLPGDHVRAASRPGPPPWWRPHTMSAPRHGGRSRFPTVRTSRSRHPTHLHGEGVPPFPVGGCTRELVPAAERWRWPRADGPPENPRAYDPRVAQFGRDRRSVATAGYGAGPDSGEQAGRRPWQGARPLRRRSRERHPVWFDARGPRSRVCTDTTLTTARSNPYEDAGITRVVPSELRRAVRGGAATSPRAAAANTPLVAEIASFIEMHAATSDRDRRRTRAMIRVSFIS